MEADYVAFVCFVMVLKESLQDGAPQHAKETIWREGYENKQCLTKENRARKWKVRRNFGRKSIEDFAFVDLESKIEIKSVTRWC